MLDIETAINFRREVCEHMDNELIGIEHTIKSKLSDIPKIERVAEFHDKLEKSKKVLSFLDDWVSSRLLDPQNKRK